LVGIINPVETAVTVLGKNLREIEVGEAGVKNWIFGVVLIPVRNVDVIEAGLKRLDELVIQQFAFALENHGRIQRKSR
jgi:hypothetical protein